MKQGGTAKTAFRPCARSGLFLLPNEGDIVTPRNDTHDFYDAIARYYPLFYRDWQTQMDREGLSLRSIFRNRGVMRVLDAACGIGVSAIPLAKLDFEVVAVDPSAGMLAQAQDFAEYFGVLDKITFERGELMELTQLVTGPFDAVICKGDALPHLLLDDEIETALLSMYDLLRPGGTLVIGMRDFTSLMEYRPRFLPGFDHVLEDDSEFITFDLWEWEDGPPVLATQNLFIVQGKGKKYDTTRHRVMFRPLSTDEVKVVLVDIGFEEILDQSDRGNPVLVARRPLAIKQSPLWTKRNGKK
jgi:SAM-dependent methyltransferase